MTKQILCAVDLTHKDTEKPILQEAAKLADLYGAGLSVVTVVPDYGMTVVGSFFKDSTMKDLVAETDRQLHAFVAEVLPDRAVQHIVEVGTIYEEILEAIDESGADLVVMGAHKPELADRFQGPNSARVARYAKVSVLILRGV